MRGCAQRYDRGERFEATSSRSALGFVTVATIGIVGFLGFGIVASMVSLGARALDVHAHQCDTCGHAWRHAGRLNLGSEAAHTCERCGARQWWRQGEREAFSAWVREPIALAAFDQAGADR